MTKIVTNQTLFELRNDINKQVQGSICFSLFHQQKIKQFYQQNREYLQVMDVRIDSLIKKYVQHDNELKPVVIERKYQFLSEDYKESYIREYQEFMEKNITLHI